MGQRTLGSTMKYIAVGEAPDRHQTGIGRRNERLNEIRHGHSDQPGSGSQRRQPSQADRARHSGRSSDGQHPAKVAFMGFTRANTQMEPHFSAQSSTRLRHRSDLSLSLITTGVATLTRRMTCRSRAVLALLVNHLRKLRQRDAAASKLFCCQLKLMSVDHKNFFDGENRESCRCYKLKLLTTIFGFK